MSGAQLDPARLAAFFSLPGAAELVEAFSAIPPGPVRQSIVLHAQALAQASLYLPPPAPEPILGAPARMLGLPARNGMASISSDGQIVERLLQGETPAAVAADLKLDIEVIFALQRKARREGGLTFPHDGTPAAGKSKASKIMAKIRSLPPIPPPPWWWQDADSPIWENGDLLPVDVAATRGSMAALGPMSSRVFKQMTAFAKKKGMSLRGYVARRADIVRRAKGGQPPMEIARSLGERPDQVYSVLAQVGYGALDAAKDHERLAVGPGVRGSSA